MKTTLKIAAGLSLPLELVTESFSILAKKRMGKSYAARRIAEQLFKAGLQIVIADPKGDWWGVRSAADGKSPGLSILILGGEHGDLPLEVGSGELVAKLVVEERVSVLLDLSLFRKHEVATFMTAFAEAFYRLKALEANRTPVMFLVDEADAVAPQTPGPNELRMLGAISDIVRRGGQRGIGCGLITQRAALLNKSVLTQTQLLVLLRTTSPQDRDAVKDWVKAAGTKAQFDELSESLTSLPKGDAWFWSPGWPTEEGIFQRAHVLPIETFDSGKTPEVGEKRIEPKKRADVDVEALRRQMAETIERAKATDPKALQARVRELEAQVKKLEAAKTPAPKVETKTREVYVLKEGQLKRIEKLVEKVLATGTQLESAAKMLLDVTASTRPAIAPAPLNPTPIPAAQIQRYTPPPAPASPRVARADVPRAAPAAESTDGSVSPVEQRILNTIAGMAALGVAQPDKATVAALVGYHPNAKSYSNAMGHLRTTGYVEYAIGGRVALTDVGRANSQGTIQVSSRAELHEMWFRQLGGVAEKILRPLLEHYPSAVSTDEVAAAAGYHPNAKSFSNTKGRLRTLGLIDYPGPGSLAATDLLFPAALP